MALFYTRTLADCLVGRLARQLQFALSFDAEGLRTCCNLSLLVETCVEKLIEEVEKRPALYKKNLKEYSDANLKKRLWEEVCEIIIPDWNQLSAEEKTKQGHDVQKKWANLRTCFRRELNTQKNTKSGQAAVKRRKYVYFEQLLFLLPCMENRQTESNLERNDSQDDEDENNESDPSTSIPSTQRQKRSNVPKKTNLDEALLKALNEPNTPDEDTNFALSLVPSLQQLTPEEKLDAKIGILNVLKQIRLARHALTSSQSTCSYNILQQPMSAFPVYHRGASVLQPPQALQPSTSKYVPNPAPSPNLPSLPNVPNTPSPGNSNDTAQSYFSNFSDESELYDL